MTNTNLVSYNCRGLPSDVNMIPSKPFITKILNDSSFVCFQETFYTKQDLPFLNNLHSDFHGTGVTTTDNKDKIMHGHAPGGVAILWRTCFDNCVKPLLFDFNWIVGIELTIDHKKIVLLNFYLPYTHPDNEEEYLNCLGSIACILTELDCTCVMIVGDFNANISRGLFGDHLVRFVKETGLSFSSKLFLPSDTFTFLSEAWDTTSWLDHCISSADGHSIINDIHIDYDGAISDHFPVYIDMSLEKVPSVVERTSSDEASRFDWDKISPERLTHYCNITDSSLASVHLPSHALACKDPNCSDISHTNDIGQ